MPCDFGCTTCSSYFHSHLCYSIIYSRAHRFRSDGLYALNTIADFFSLFVCSPPMQCDIIFLRRHSSTRSQNPKRRKNAHRIIIWVLWSKNKQELHTLVHRVSLNGEKYTCTCAVCMSFCIRPNVTEFVAKLISLMWLTCLLEQVLGQLPFLNIICSVYLHGCCRKVAAKYLNILAGRRRWAYILIWWEIYRNFASLHWWAHERKPKHVMGISERDGCCDFDFK